VLRVSFHGGQGDSPTLMLASFVRFCADGTLRGPDNYVIARCVEGLWHVGGRAHRELDCEGPVRVRITSLASLAPVHMGPFQRLRTINGVLHGDEASLHVLMPGRNAEAATPCHELAFLSPPEDLQWPNATTDKPSEIAKKPARRDSSRS
jgi:hypothetical protein